MSQRKHGSIRLLCGLGVVLVTGLLASPAFAQDNQSDVSTTVGTYLSVSFDEVDPAHDFFVVPGDYNVISHPGVAIKQLSQNFTAMGNVPMTVSGTLVKPTRASPAPTTAPGAWSIKLDGGPEIAFPGTGAVSYPAGFHPGQGAQLKVSLTLADGGGGPTYTGGTLTLTIAPT